MIRSCRRPPPIVGVTLTRPASFFLPRALSQTMPPRTDSSHAGTGPSSTTSTPKTGAVPTGPGDQDVAYLILDVESVADGALVAEVRYNEPSMNPEQAVARYRGELARTNGNDFVPYTFQIPSRSRWPKSPVNSNSWMSKRSTNRTIGPKRSPATFGKAGRFTTNQRW